jgi:hypothetical protein
LGKALYGLKQAPCVWYSRLSDKPHSLGFSPSKADISLFHYKKGLVTIFLLIYADDIIIASSSSSAATQLLQALKNDFTLKDLGPLQYFLGVEVSWSANGLHVSQKKYTIDVLQHAGMTTCKPAPTTLSRSTKISAQLSTPLSSEDATKYCDIVGALQYLTLTHPDISFACGK